MSSLQANNAPPKKSFAQVAAAANISIISKEKSQIKPNQIPSGQSVSKGANIPLLVRQELGSKLEVKHDSKLEMQPESKFTINGSSHISPQLDIVSPKIAEVHLLNGLLQRVHLQDGPSRTSSSECIFKKEMDTKSVTSRTTLTLDEKESLRPDDSASVQAAAEEDAFSPSGSVVAGSREGSDPEARAFRDQLNAIDRTGATGLVPQQLPSAVVVPVLETRNGGIIYPVPVSASNIFNAGDGIRLEPPRVISGELANTPDEKLLEALASPKDRLFVLKIEQDMIDFVRDSKEEFLQLPQTNSFYRMLSHKLADYYMLGHIIDESMTSVRIYRTPHARLPPPLIGPASSSADGSTPPPTAPARKIMRRMIEGGSHRSGEVKRTNSQTPSTAASDAGAGSGGDDGNDESSKKDKAALTREERESRYREARARIFKDFKEEPVEMGEGANGSAEKEISRSSSASGVKKGKKHRKPKDDGFEARSAYSQYGNQTFSPSGLNTPASDSPFYNPFAPYAMPDQIALSSRNHEIDQQLPGPGYSPYNQQPQSSMSMWGGIHPGHGYIVPPTPNVSSFHTQDNYDSNNVFGSSIQSFPSPNISSQLTPKVATQSMYSPEYMPQNDNLGWSPLSFSNSYAGAGMMYNGTTSGDHNVSTSQSQYASHVNPYGGFSTQDQQYYSPQSHHPAFNRQQFNPRSQVFTPSLRGGLGSPMHQGQNFAYPQPPLQYANPLPRQVSGTSLGSGYNSPYGTQPSLSGNRLNNYSQPRPQAQSARVTQPGVSSSISKWGNPATLPPKPPPPAIQSPFFEVPRDPQNQQPLPPNPYSNLLRSSSNNNVGVQSSH